MNITIIYFSKIIKERRKELQATELHGNLFKDINSSDASYEMQSKNTIVLRSENHSKTVKPLRS